MKIDSRYYAALALALAIVAMQNAVIAAHRWAINDSHAIADKALRQWGEAVEGWSRSQRSEIASLDLYEEAAMEAMRCKLAQKEAQR